MTPQSPDIPSRVQAFLHEGFALQQAGNLPAARACYAEALTLNPRQFDALQLSGVIAAQLGAPEEAVALLKRAIAVDPNNVGTHYNLGYVLEDMKRIGEALAQYARVLALKPDHVMALNNRGTALAALGRHGEAIASFDAAIALAPDFADAHHNRGLALTALGDHAAALASLDRAIAVRPDHAEALLSRALALREMRQLLPALAASDEAQRLAPGNPHVHNIRGTILSDLHRHSEALASYDRAIHLNPDLAEAHNNRGLALTAVHQPAAALVSFDRAIALAPGFAGAHHDRAVALGLLMRLEEAVAGFDAALRLKPDYDYLRGARLYARMRICDWSGFDTELADIASALARGEKVSATFPIVAASDSPLLQRRAAEIWTNHEAPRDAVLGPIPARPASARIRVGYFSMDFRIHPVSFLAAGMFEAHDRAGFETFAFSYGPDTGDPMRKRLEKAFDHFIDVREKTDRDIAAQARSLNIDIAVDLAGHTTHARTGIFALRAAPVQVSYLGFPGTMGSDYIDYLIADEVIAPDAHRAQYAEKIVCLPSFQVNDKKREISPRVFSRRDLGLPETGVVYCCFNSTYKITPAVFDDWMRILAGVEGSTLLLHADNPAAETNLRKEAALRGIDPSRLVYGERLALPEYLARFRTPDLFLDTLPYNAGTTASDALWAGLPVLTRRGQAFAGRMASSILTALDMPELITDSREAYVDLAIWLACDPTRLAALKDKLARRRATSPLFDTTRFTRDIEAAYTYMRDRAAAGLPPAHVHIPPR